MHSIRTCPASAEPRRELLRIGRPQSEGRPAARPGTGARAALWPSSSTAPAAGTGERGSTGGSCCADASGHCGRRPISRVTSAGHRHDSLAFEPVMAGIRIRRRRGRPRTRPAREAYSSRAIPLSPATTSDQGDHPGAGRPTEKPATAREFRWPTIRVRRRAVQAAQRRRAGDQQAQGQPRGRHPLRQARLQVPRNHRRRPDQDLTPRPSHDPRDTL